MLDIERRERERTIILAKLRAVDEAEFLKRNDAIYLTAKNAAYLKNAVDMKKIQDDLTAKQVEKWKQETAELIAELKARITARQDFENQLGQGAAGLGLDRSVAGGIKEVNDLRKSVEKSGQEIAFLEREGILTTRDAMDERIRLQEAFAQKVQALRDKFGEGQGQFFNQVFDEGNLRILEDIFERGVPALAPVLDSLNRLVSDVGFGNFGLQVDKGRQFIDRFVASSSQVNQSLDDLHARLTLGVPDAIDKASPELQKLRRDYDDLARSIGIATIEAANFQRALSGGGVGVPTNTGVVPVPEP